MYTKKKKNTPTNNNLWCPITTTTVNGWHTVLLVSGEHNALNYDKAIFERLYYHIIFTNFFLQRICPIYKNFWKISLKISVSLSVLCINIRMLMKINHLHQNAPRFETVSRQNVRETQSWVVFLTMDYKYCLRNTF